MFGGALFGTGSDFIVGQDPALVICILAQRSQECRTEQGSFLQRNAMPLEQGHVDSDAKFRSIFPAGANPLERVTPDILVLAKARKYESHRHPFRLPIIGTDCGTLPA